MNTTSNTVETEEKVFLNSECIKAFLSDEERLDFEANLQWVIAQTTSSMLQFKLEDVYSLMEDFLREWLNVIWSQILEMVLSSSVFLDVLKALAAKRGYHFKGMRPLSIRCPGGKLIKVQSPYFLKANSKRKGRKKKRP